MRLTVLSVCYPLSQASPSTAGGAEQVLLALDAALVRAGHRSLVIAPEGSRTQGLLLATPAARSPLTDEVKQRARREQRKAIERALASFPVDVIHFHGIDFLDYLPRPGIPAIVTLHLPPDWYPSSALHVDRPDTYLVCVSRSQRLACPAGVDIAAVVTNGVSVEMPPPDRKRGNYLLSVGRICPEKNFHIAIEVANRTGLPLYLAGQTFDYPEHRAYFETEIRSRLSAPHKFLGPVGGERKRRLFAGARCLLIPSTAAETSSLVAMESLACGTPVLAYRSGALPEIIDHGRTGFLVDSPDQMVSFIPKVSNLDPRVCIQTAETRFSAKLMFAGYLDLYQRVVSSQVHGFAS